MIILLAFFLEMDLHHTIWEKVRNLAFNSGLGSTQCETTEHAVNS
jgi:hypothetical protein